VLSLGRKGEIDMDANEIPTAVHAAVRETYWMWDIDFLDEWEIDKPNTNEQPSEKAS
jgi:hypothetical protein